VGWIVAYEEVYEGRTAAHRRRGARAGEEEQEEGDEVDEAHWFDFLDRDSKMTRKFKTYTRYHPDEKRWSATIGLVGFLQLSKCIHIRNS
jgi:hypothetical protein